MVYQFQNQCYKGLVICYWGKWKLHGSDALSCIAKYKIWRLSYKVGKYYTPSLPSLRMFAESLNGQYKQALRASSFPTKLWKHKPKVLRQKAHNTLIYFMSPRPSLAPNEAHQQMRVCHTAHNENHNCQIINWNGQQ